MVGVVDPYMQQQTMCADGAGVSAEVESETRVTHVSFILEVEAENRRELGDKLYGYDDLEAERVAMGYDPHNDDIDYEYIRDARWDERASETDICEIQAEQETVNDLLNDAAFDGHGVLVKTDGTNLGSPSEATEIPHFRHSAGCDNSEACHDHPDAGGVYRLFSPADLILDGAADTDILREYKLRDDVLVSLVGIGSNPSPGTTEATPVSGDEFEL